MGILISLFMSCMWMMARLFIVMFQLMFMLLRVSIPFIVLMLRGLFAAMVWMFKGAALLLAVGIPAIIALVRGVRKQPNVEGAPEQR